MSTEKKVVKFLKGWRGYNAGETAGFDTETADTLIDGDVAEANDGAAAPRTGGARRRAGKGGQGEGAGKADGAGEVPPANSVGGEGGDGSGAPGSIASPLDNADRP
ncbi:hypothetical protein [Acidovorax sp. BLS4]|uniref:hypothetical protein n=1 Tax=Acidovorax sp. BLS4 TaxID=3273430 RepID=UPI00294298DD|nr:hypothetical protein [Paracidovorax avenae]WOI43779.1 hypothetical protein R1Z03_14665 [Paracidovorax avenae]